jgi:hypothetical protein
MLDLAVYPVGMLEPEETLDLSFNCPGHHLYRKPEKWRFDGSVRGGNERFAVGRLILGRCASCWLEISDW